MSEWKSKSCFLMGHWKVIIKQPTEFLHQNYPCNQLNNTDSSNEHQAYWYPGNLIPCQFLEAIQRCWAGFLSPSCNAPFQDTYLGKCQQQFLLCQDQSFLFELKQKKTQQTEIIEQTLRISWVLGFFFTISYYPYVPEQPWAGKAVPKPRYSQKCIRMRFSPLQGLSKYCTYCEFLKDTQGTAVSKFCIEWTRSLSILKTRSYISNRISFETARTAWKVLQPPLWNEKTFIEIILSCAIVWIWRNTRGTGTSCSEKL